MEVDSVQDAEWEYELFDDVGETAYNYYSMRWLSLSGWFFLAVLGLLIPFKVRSNFWGVSLAYVNCLIIFGSIIHFLKKWTTEALVPVFTFPVFFFAWPLATVYFAVFYPEARYVTYEGTITTYMLDGALRVQTAVFLFLLGYLPIVWLAVREKALASSTPARRPKLVANVIAVFSMIILGVHVISKLITVPDLAVYLVEGLLKYYNGLLFVVGALITNVSKKMKIALVVFLAVMVFFYTLGNARGWAIIPVFMFLMGILFLSRTPAKTKFIILVCIAVLFPIYVVIGNVTRILTGTAEFKDIAYRLGLLKEWRTATADTPPVYYTIHRLFHNAGHNVVINTPENSPYLAFAPLGFLKETFMRLIPGRLWFSPYYSGYWMLTYYGFRIEEKSTIEISLIGNLWLLGGYRFVFAGGVVLGFLHCLVMSVIRRASMKSEVKALLFIGVFGPLLISTDGVALIDCWRNLVWCLIFVFVLWWVVALFTGEWQRGKGTEYGYSDST